MAISEHLEIFERGNYAWNTWRDANPGIKPDLSGASLSYHKIICPDHTGSNFRDTIFHRCEIMGHDKDYPKETPLFNNTDFTNADFRDASFLHVSMNNAVFDKAYLTNARFYDVIMKGSNFNKTHFTNARLTRVSLEETTIEGCDLTGAILREVNLSKAALLRTSLTATSLISTDIRGASIIDCHVYGVSTWDTIIDDSTVMIDLSIAKNFWSKNQIRVDNLELAQFMYLLLNNEKIRYIIDTITSKVVLILGRFTEPRKQVLDSIRNELRNSGYTPILFDFQKPSTRDLTETISTLAHMARFIIADITDAKSIPQELQAIVPNLPSVPVQPLLLASQKEYGMFEHFKRYRWVLNTYFYKSQEELISSLKEKVIKPAEMRSKKRNPKSSKR
jgi:uncharacterized protein YjbI with pentapeptide repeats